MPIYRCTNSAIEEYLQKVIAQHGDLCYFLDFLDDKASSFYLNLIGVDEPYPMFIFDADDAEEGLTNIEPIWGIYMVSGGIIYLSGEKNNFLFEKTSKYGRITQQSVTKYPNYVDTPISRAFLIKDRDVHIIDFVHDSISPIKSGVIEK